MNIPPTSGRRVMFGGHELRICCVQTGSGVTERMGVMSEVEKIRWRGGEEI